MARIDSVRAAMFGGRGKEGGSNQLWVIDLDDNVSVCLLLIVMCAVYMQIVKLSMWNLFADVTINTLHVI